MIAFNNNKHNERKRPLAMIIVETFLFPHLFRDGTSFTVSAGIPADSNIVSVNFNGTAAHIVLEHSSFDHVPSGASIPVIPITITEILNVDVEG